MADGGGAGGPVVPAEGDMSGAVSDGFFYPESNGLFNSMRQRVEDPWLPRFELSSRESGHGQWWRRAPKLHDVFRTNPQLRTQRDKQDRIAPYLERTVDIAGLFAGPAGAGAQGRPRAAVQHEARLLRRREKGGGDRGRHGALAVDLAHTAPAGGPRHGLSPVQAAVAKTLPRHHGIVVPPPRTLEEEQPMVAATGASATPDGACSSLDLDAAPPEHAVKRHPARYIHVGNPARSPRYLREDVPIDAFDTPPAAAVAAAPSPHAAGSTTGVAAASVGASVQRMPEVEEGDAGGGDGGGASNNAVVWVKGADTAAAASACSPRVAVIATAPSSRRGGAGDASACAPASPPITVAVAPPAAPGVDVMNVRATMTAAQAVAYDRELAEHTVGLPTADFTDGAYGVVGTDDAVAAADRDGVQGLVADYIDTAGYRPDPSARETVKTLHYIRMSATAADEFRAIQAAEAAALMAAAEEEEYSGAEGDDDDAAGELKQKKKRKKKQKKANVTGGRVKNTLGDGVAAMDLVEAFFLTGLPAAVERQTSGGSAGPRGAGAATQAGGRSSRAGSNDSLCDVARVVRRSIGCIDMHGEQERPAAGPRGRHHARDTSNLPSVAGDRPGSAAVAAGIGGSRSPSQRNVSVSFAVDSTSTGGGGGGIAPGGHSPTDSTASSPTHRRAVVPHFGTHASGRGLRSAAGGPGVPRVVAPVDPARPGTPDAYARSGNVHPLHHALAGSAGEAINPFEIPSVFYDSLNTSVPLDDAARAKQKRAIAVKMERERAASLSPDYQLRKALVSVEKLSDAELAALRTHDVFGELVRREQHRRLSVELNWKDRQSSELPEAVIATDLKIEEVLRRGRASQATIHPPTEGSACSTPTPRPLSVALSPASSATRRGGGRKGVGGGVTPRAGGGGGGGDAAHTLAKWRLFESLPVCPGAAAPAAAQLQEAFEAKHAAATPSRTVVKNPHYAQAIAPKVRGGERGERAGERDRPGQGGKAHATAAAAAAPATGADAAAGGDVHTQYPFGMWVTLGAPTVWEMGVGRAEPGPGGNPVPMPTPLLLAAAPGGESPAGAANSVSSKDTAGSGGAVHDAITAAIPATPAVARGVVDVYGEPLLALYAFLEREELCQKAWEAGRGAGAAPPSPQPQRGEPQLTLEEYASLRQRYMRYFLQEANACRTNNDFAEVAAGFGAAQGKRLAGHRFYRPPPAKSDKNTTAPHGDPMHRAGVKLSVCSSVASATASSVHPQQQQRVSHTSSSTTVNAGGGGGARASARASPVPAPLDRGHVMGIPPMRGAKGAKLPHGDPLETPLQSARSHATVPGGRGKKAAGGAGKYSTATSAHQTPLTAGLPLGGQGRWTPAALTVHSIVLRFALLPVWAGADMSESHPLEVTHTTASGVAVRTKVPSSPCEHPEAANYSILWDYFHAMLQLLYPNLLQKELLAIQQHYEREPPPHPSWLHNYPWRALRDMADAFHLRIKAQRREHARSSTAKNMSQRLREAVRCEQDAIFQRYKMREATFLAIVGAAKSGNANVGSVESQAAAQAPKALMGATAGGGESVAGMLTRHRADRGYVPFRAYVERVGIGHFDTEAAAHASAILPHASKIDPVKAAAHATVIKRKQNMDYWASRAFFDHPANRDDFLSFTQGPGLSLVYPDLKANPFTALKHQMRAQHGVRGGDEPDGAAPAADKPAKGAPNPQWAGKGPVRK